jgi:hypothetical protein
MNSNSLNRNKSYPNNFKLRIRRNSSCIKFDNQIDDLRGSGNNNFIVPKDNVKMKLKEYFENKQKQIFEFRTIVNHHKVFNKQTNNFYTTDYMNKVSRLMKKSDKDYFNKRMLIQKKGGGVFNNKNDIYITDAVMSCDKDEYENNLFSYNLKINNPRYSNQKECQTSQKIQLLYEDELDLSSESYLNNSKEKIIRENVFKKLNSEYYFYKKDRNSINDKNENFLINQSSTFKFNQTNSSSQKFYSNSNVCTIESSTDLRHLGKASKNLFLPSFNKKDLQKSIELKNVSFGRTIKLLSKPKTEYVSKKKIKNYDYDLKTTNLINCLMKDLKSEINNC